MIDLTDDDLDALYIAVSSAYGESQLSDTEWKRLSKLLNDEIEKRKSDTLYKER